MKKITTRILATILAITMLIGVTATPVQAKTKITANTVEITTHNEGYSRSYDTYNTKAEADAAPIIFYVDKNDLPVEVIISAAESSKEKYSFSSYGMKYVKDYWRGRYIYATIDIEPYPPKQQERTATTIEVPTEDEIIDEKLKTLLKEIDNFDYFCYVENTPYSKELRAFLTGDWDGSVIQDKSAEDAYAGYLAWRQVCRRNYQWHGTNHYSGETVKREVNVDYNGYLEIIRPNTDRQDFSFAVSRANKIFEQWRFLEKLDSWTLPDDAGVIDSIYLIGTNQTDPEECQALVNTLDTEGQQHMYSLLPGGVVSKLQ